MSNINHLLNLNIFTWRKSPAMEYDSENLHGKIKISEMQVQRFLYNAHIMGLLGYSIPSTLFSRVISKISLTSPCVPLIFIDPPFFIVCLLIDTKTPNPELSM